LEPLSQTPIGPGRLYRLAWTFYLILGLAGVVWVGLRRGRIPLALFVDLGGWWIDLAAGLAAGAALLALWAGAARLVALARRLETEIGAVLGPLTAGEAVALAIFSGVAEELFFRGAVQGSLPGLAGWLLATVLFALLHSGPGPAFRLWTLFALLAGALFGALMLWRGNLLAPVVAHFLVNAVNLKRVSDAAVRSEGAAANFAPK
jgi:membrane protease YdiL (CAAX protease family)